MTVVLVRGSGDVGSAVAHLLFTRGHRVVLHDLPCPPHPRRGMAFTDAFYDGTRVLEGVCAKRASHARRLPPMVACGGAVPVTDAPFEEVLEAVGPDVLCDARMRKHEFPSSQRGLAPLTVGLGPRFTAGENVDLVVETAWGDELGALIRTGSARPLAGDPRSIAGHGRDRYAVAPREGRFSTRLEIGASVARGEEVARIGEHVVAAPLSGVLRGLTRDGARVLPAMKVVEVDPRGEPESVFGVGERPRRIALGVLAAIAAAFGPG